MINVNRIALGVWVVMAGLGSSGSAHAESTSDRNRVEISVEALLTPHVGYEEKNNIQVVLYGVLPNACYTLAESQVDRLDEKTFAVKQFAFRDTTGVCANETTMPMHMKMTIPFMQEVAVGRLPMGDYQFTLSKAGSDNALLPKTMNVAKNVTSTVDSLPYAAVTAVQAPDVEMSLNRLVVKVQGILNSTCTSLDPNVKVMRQDDVLVLLPTVQVRNDVICAQVTIPFEKEVDLGQVEPGVHLVHTRSMNGKAINKVVQISR